MVKDYPAEPDYRSRLARVYHNLGVVNVDTKNWAEAFRLKTSDKSRALLEPIHAGGQEEIRLRAAMMASVDEGVGMLFEALERSVVVPLNHSTMIVQGTTNASVPARSTSARPRCGIR